MALKDIFTMIKANKYTADGCEELNKAREAETEDARRTYQIGEISEATGLQKTANGWRPVKKGAGTPPAGRNLGAKKVPRGPGAIHTPGKGSIGMEEMKEAAEKGLKGQKLKEFMMSKKEESKPGKQPKLTAEEKNTYKDIVREYMKNPSPATERIMNEAKNHLMKNRGASPAEIGEMGRSVFSEKSEPESKPAAGNNLKWNEMPNGRVWTSKTPGGKPLTVTWNREKNGDVWYGRSDSDIKYKSKEEAMNAPVAKEKKRLTWSPNASVSEKFNDIIKLGAKSEDRTKRPGGYIGPKAQENYIRKALSKRLGATEESIDDLLEGMDDITRKNAFNGFMENYSEDSAPRVLTGDCRIRIRKEKPALTGDTKIRVRK